MLFIYREDYYLKAHEPKHPMPDDTAEASPKYEEWKAKHARSPAWPK